MIFVSHSHRWLFNRTYISPPSPGPAIENSRPHDYVAPSHVFQIVKSSEAKIFFSGIIQRSLQPLIYQPELPTPQLPQHPQPHLITITITSRLHAITYHCITPTTENKRASARCFLATISSNYGTFSLLVDFVQKMLCYEGKEPRTSILQPMRSL